MANPTECKCRFKEILPSNIYGHAPDCPQYIPAPPNHHHCGSAHCISGSLKHENGCACYCRVCLPRQPYSPPKLRKLDPRCVEATETTDPETVHVPPINGIIHVSGCTCDK